MRSRVKFFIGFAVGTFLYRCIRFGGLSWEAAIDAVAIGLITTAILAVIDRRTKPSQRHISQS